MTYFPIKSSHNFKLFVKKDRLYPIFKQAGAIPLCVTNVSAIGCWWESSNPVYGVSKNPYDILRTPGGSSGGEAALQTAAGIPLSLGNLLIGIILNTIYNCKILKN